MAQSIRLIDVVERLEARLAEVDRLLLEHDAEMVRLRCERMELRRTLHCPAEGTPRAAYARDGDARQHILSALAAVQPASGTTVAKAVGKAQGTVYHCLERCVELGLVQRHADKRYSLRRLT